MKLLIISPDKGLYKSTKTGYNGVGWVASLQEHLEKEADIKLAFAFVSSIKKHKEKFSNTTYYHLYKKKTKCHSKIDYIQRRI